MLRDLRDNDEIFGGITTVLGGDFLQTLPVVKMNLQSPIVHACLLSSMLWPAIKTNVLKLERNMCVCYVWTSLHTQIHRIASFPISFLPLHTEAHVRYDLASLLCTI